MTLPDDIGGLGDLGDAARTVAAALDGTVESARDGDASWSAGGREFAFLGRGWIDLRLDPAVAVAAARTPDTAPSARGPEWVRFSPTALDDHALDRLEAWFGLAHRRAQR